MTISPQDVSTLTQTIMKNVPEEEQATALALINIGLHAIGTLDRIATSFERIAAAIEKDMSDHE